MIFVLDVLAFVLCAILICIFCASVVLAASFIYVCIKSAALSTKGKKEDENDG